MNRAEIVAKHRQYLYDLATYYSVPLPFVRGEGKWLFDDAGKKYLDFFGGIVTVGLGHCEPRVVAALEKQIRTLQHVSTLFPTVPLVELAERLCELFPGERPAKAFFSLWLLTTNSRLGKRLLLISNERRYREEKQIST